MEENQNGMYGEETPRTYGEESKMYENLDKQKQQAGYEQPNPYSQSYGQPDQQYGYNNQNYGQSNQQYGYNNQSYGQPNQQYGYNNGAYMNGAGMHTSVKDVFCNILLVIMPLRIILSMIVTILTFSAIDSYESIVSGSYLTKLSGGAYSMLSMLSSILFIAYVIFVVLDVVAVNKGNYKILGLILFAIFLNPGYYIWRAHILGRKKAIPVIYTVVYSILMIASVMVAFYYGLTLGMEMTNSLYY